MLNNLNSTIISMQNYLINEYRTIKILENHYQQYLSDNCNYFLDEDFFKLMRNSIDRVQLTEQAKLNLIEEDYKNVKR